MLYDIDKSDIKDTFYTPFLYHFPFSLCISIALVDHVWNH